MKKLILTIIMSAAWLTGILAQDAVYIYRNDGNFDAFLTEDVDSIVFMTVPVDSMGNPEYPFFPDSTSYYSYKTGNGNNEISLQVVYTPNEVHYIPMNVVDSISFVAPPVLFTDDVINMEENMWKHITNVNGLTLQFASTLPEKLVPGKNRILFCTDQSCPHFNEGFAGRVKTVTATAGGYTVNCEPITDINDIFKQLIGVERVTSNDSPKNMPTRIGGEYEIGECDVDFGLDYKRKTDNWEMTVGGNIKGKIKGTIVYNISKKIQKIELKLNHDWQAAAHLDAKTSGEYSVVSDGKPIFTKYFPIKYADVFKIEITAHTFAEFRGSADLSYEIKSPKYKYETTFTFLNGKFTSNDTRIENDNKQDDNIAHIFNKVNIDGSAHVGGMARVSFSTLKCFGAFFKGAAEIYIGPKLSGHLHFDNTLEDKGEYYHGLKDSKIWVDAIAAHAKFTAEAKLDDDHHFQPEPIRLEIGTLFTKEWYLLPEFTNLWVNTYQDYASVSCAANRHLLMPVSLGFELLDSDGKGQLGRWYDSREYQNNNGQPYIFANSFDGLLNGKTYRVRPLVKLMGIGMSADIEKEFTMPESTKPLCPDDHHPHMIDLGLPSGKKWACCNVGAAEPEGYGGYYAWAETFEKSTYSWDNYTHYTPPQQGNIPIKDPYRTDIRQNIEGTEYDVAHTTWGNGWRMPTKEEYEELKQNCILKWTNYNGVDGMMVTGKDGNRIFLPAAGYSKTQNQGTGGYYWYGTFIENNMAGANTLFRITQTAGGDTTKGIESSKGASIRAIKE